MDPAALSKKIVIVEDDLRLAEIYKTRLELQGYSCYVAYNGIIALYFIQQDTPDLVLLDLMIPDIAGDEVLRVMRRSS
jgi:DNA-binding response OmpR family regulator